MCGLDLVGLAPSDSVMSNVMLLNAFVMGWPYTSSWEICSGEETFLKIATGICQEIQGHTFLYDKYHLLFHVSSLLIN
jgi:hypothetical protein